MLYRVVKITDLNGEDKIEKDYIDRICRVVDVDYEKIKINERLFMECKEPDFMKSIVTSWVKKVTKADDGIVITTENSIYFLVEKETADQYDELLEHLRADLEQHFDMNGDYTG